ncbi:MAG: YebC/PmpR family DNA-binding transcriptional regulator [Candidatus Komeilibacteria bacterium]|nr:YebC/PmpR family DNA-binding transcriptional regulator [Candidatus Komeilibacteria bacterium]
MSGHSKWATTKRRKEGVDAKKSANFTKLANVIAVAARSGGDPETNFKLRMAIDKAKEFRLPKENIDRAVKKGTGELGGEQMEEIIYEAYGPAGLALVMEIVTDNKNRAASEVKHVLNKYGGNLAGPGATMWMFDHRGVITLDKEKLTDDEELALIDAGALDIKTDSQAELGDGGVTVYTAPDQFENIKKKIAELNIPILESNIEYVAKDSVKVSNEETILKFFDDLEALDDVSNFYSNADL